MAKKKNVWLLFTRHWRLRPEVRPQKPMECSVGLGLCEKSKGNNGNKYHMYTVDPYTSKYTIWWTEDETCLKRQCFQLNLWSTGRPEAQRHWACSVLIKRLGIEDAGMKQKWTMESKSANDHRLYPLQLGSLELEKATSGKATTSISINLLRLLFVSIASENSAPVQP